MLFVFFLPIKCHKFNNRFSSPSLYHPETQETTVRSPTRLNRFLTFCLVVLTAVPLRAEQLAATQTTTPIAKSTLTPAGDRYSAEPALIESNDREITIAADGTGSERQTIAVRVQTEAAVKELSVVSFPFASASQHVDINYIRVRHPDGSVVETPVADAIEMPTEVMRQAPFYSDLKQKQIPIRGLRPGDRLEWSVQMVRSKAEAPGRFWGISAFTGKGRVALAETFTLRVPKSIPSTVWSPKQSAKISEEGVERVYRWTSSQLEPTVGAEAEARTEAEKKRVLTPEEISDRTDGTLPLIAWTNFPDWFTVGAWYRELANDRHTPDATIKAKAAQLTAGKTTDEEKIRALYAYVSTEIRYIGVALGQGRYQPHLASEVLANQYGDCKDKATLLASLLEAVGYKADTVLIGPGIRFNEAVPSPAAFSHAITAVSLGSGATSQTIWLDSTQEVAPYRALFSVERDKQVLRIPVDSPAHLDRTPHKLPFDSFQHFEADGTLDTKGLVKGRLSYTFRGDDEIALRAAIRQISPAQYDQFAQYLLGSMGFGGKVTHATFTPPEHTEEPLVMGFDYERDKPGGDWDNYRIVVLDSTDGLPTVDEKEPPQLPIDLGTPRTMTTISRIAMPSGWGATPPESVHQQTPWINFDRTYRVEHGILIEEKKIEILQQKIPITSWHDYEKFADVVSPGTYPYVQLSRSSDTGGSTPGPPPPVKNNPEAARLIDQAAKANQQHQIGEAGELIEQAKALNDEQAYLWSVSGYRAILRGEPTEAVTDYTRELKLHPNEGNIYPQLAAAQLAQGKPHDAEATLQRRLETVGPDAGISIQLAQMLLEDENFAEAVVVAEVATKAEPENQRLVWLLGRTRMKAGQKAAGLSTLSVALREADDPGLRNDIAYELTDAGYATDEVETATRKVVDQLTAETAAWTLTNPDQDITEMRRRSSLLVASWDTLGWTIYKSPTGHQPARLAEAERYLAAAWHNDLHAEVGLHLGDLQEALHRSGEALATYQLADVASPRIDLRGVHRPPTPLERELGVRIQRLKQTQLHSALQDPGDALRKQLRLNAGASSGLSVVIPYRMLLTAEGIQNAIPITTSDGDHGAPDPVKDLTKLRHAVPTALIPVGSTAQLLRSAVLNCHQDICEVIMTPLTATR
jgi:tetratricopeptide (TPR) repeat protein